MKYSKEEGSLVSRFSLLRSLILTKEVQREKN
jgi:hypothetical protein